MWPWEHAIVGYLAYSFFCRLYYRESPDGLAAFAVVLASVGPDLIDKPLTWQFGVLESGYSIGHSLFFAVPFALVAGALARAAGRPRAGIAVGIGYLSHLPADVFYHYATGSPTRWELALWPVRRTPPEGQYGLVGHTTELLVAYGHRLLAGGASGYVRLQLAIAAGAFLVWLADGAPVLREILVGGRRLLARSHAGR
ncbi:MULTISPECIES: metal-dependent hydrolase [Saliphagus]|uniref:Metal-dependent hydrolase n=1 Tax=Saliphagus infecundisoli TaxID=1849069 RepID=A0ABD5QEZ6_9EURY|nr:MULTISPECIES: metal-dependent hydrolase [Saliphagus]